ncbi:hypothetical protein NDU88_005461 [Pleurodeles waltl]|uniref:Uncharacterized protein n=1 Tax=Pleurodeles waltl TaxID=8319 RepID=A0AAV7MC60_PLEWA|nr:hypothetical protein NDU88_005461 [Pleurodeles waltl]
MPGGRLSHKNSGKLVRQLLFSEALLQMKGPPLLRRRHSHLPHTTVWNVSSRKFPQLAIDWRGWIVQWFHGLRKRNMEIASFQTRVLGLEQRVSTVEAHTSSFQDRDQELRCLRSKLTDLEDRSRKDNVHFLGFPEDIEGEDLHGFLRDMLPRLTGITFEPPLDFQRAHRLGPRRPGTDTHPDQL